MDRKLNHWLTSTRLNDIGYEGANVLHSVFQCAAFREMSGKPTR
jgi:hypothetical protein